MRQKSGPEFSLFSIPAPAHNRYTLPITKTASSGGTRHASPVTLEAYFFLVPVSSPRRPLILTHLGEVAERRILLETAWISSTLRDPVRFVAAYAQSAGVLQTELLRGMASPEITESGLIFDAVHHEVRAASSEVVMAGTERSAERMAAAKTDSLKPLVVEVRRDGELVRTIAFDDPRQEFLRAFANWPSQYGCTMEALN